MYYFDHEKFAVYQTSLEFVSLTNNIIEQLPKGKAYIADQLQRAASSISLDICHKLQLIDQSSQVKARELLLRIVAMLTKLVKNTTPA